MIKAHMGIQITQSIDRQIEGESCHTYSVLYISVRVFPYQI